MAAITPTSTPRSSAPPAPVAPATEEVERSIIITPHPAGRVNVVLIGAGGNGARIVPPLMQMLRRGDSLSIIDHDIVEDRNLTRQHFHARDIGMPKADVLWRRYRREGSGISGGAFVTQIDARNATSTIQGAIAGAREVGNDRLGTSTIVIGAVDNNQARAAIHTALRHLSGFSQVAYIDIGNEHRAGQVLTTLGLWNCAVSDNGVRRDVVPYSMNTIQIAMPQLLRPRPEDDPALGCGERLDLQTVNVNHLAAACAINAISHLLLGIPTAAAGAFFSTLNTMQSIRIVRTSAATNELIPDSSWAIAEEA